MKTIILPATLFVTSIATASISAQAAEAQLGLSLTYSPGFSDVADWHEDNLPIIPEQTSVPVGVAFRGVWHMDSGLRVDAAVGPVGLIIGDIEYIDIPVQLTLGYTFATKSKVQPYIRAGVSVHSVSGNYVVDSSNGSIGAIGLSFGNTGDRQFFVEFAVDSAEATFNASAVSGPRDETIELSGSQVTLGIVF